jgi:hypothetical protein
MKRGGFSATKVVTLLILLILTVALAGCGKKGPVRPLGQPVPKAPEEFVLRQQGQQLLLVWTLPRLNEDESLLTDLAGFRIYRNTFEVVDDCPECLASGPLWRLVDLEYLRDVERVGDRFFLNDDELATEMGYQYRIVPFNRWGQDGKPVLARQVLVKPPSAPVGVYAEGHQDRLIVTWQPAADLPAGMKLLGYNVYRRRPGQTFSPAPRNQQPIDTSFFEDRDFIKGKTYLYALRTVALKGDRIIESPLSDLAASTDAGNQEGMEGLEMK